VARHDDRDRVARERPSDLTGEPGLTDAVGDVAVGERGAVRDRPGHLVHAPGEVVRPAEIDHDGGEVGRLAPQQ
jgi:hypothetical protein